MTGMDFHLLCCLCYYTRDVPEPAVTVINGYATCDAHAQHFQDAVLQNLAAAHMRGAL